MENKFNLQGKVAVVTGGTGALLTPVCHALAEQGVSVAVLARHADEAQTLAKSLGNNSVGLACDVTQKSNLKTAAENIVKTFGRLDILINGAGGNRPEAISNEEHNFFELPQEGLQEVLNLNLMGTILSSQVFGAIMAKQQQGVILNFASMAGIRPLTRVVAYSAAKAGVANFTQWLATFMAQEISPEIRVNALAPGFFIGNQNHNLLLNPDGSLTARGETIINHTPIGRFGTPDDLVEAVLYLVSPASRFVTGVVLPVDGGFAAFAGV